MSDTITLKNKTTGEVITLKRKDSGGVLSTKKKEQKQVTPGVNINPVNTDEAIAARGTISGNIKENFVSPNPVRKLMGVAGVASAPLSAIGAMIANPALQMQAGNFNPIDLAKEAALGITGKKQGRPVDVYRRAGIPAPVASALDFAITSSPIKLAQVGKRFFGSIAKLSDKKILQAGNSLVRATEEASRFVGEKVGAAFKRVEDIPVDAKTFAENISKLPKILLGRVEEQFGKVQDISEKMTVGKLRQIKQFVGKYRPSAFGKSERGIAENIEAEDLNKVYGGFKELIKNTVKTATDEKTANELMKLEGSYSQVTRASDYVKKTVVDSTLLKPTKAGKMAGKIIEEGDVTGRTALNILRDSGKYSKKEIDRAISSLEAFNRWRSLSELGKHAANAALYGGAIGGLGGYAASKVYSRSE